jgi:hypothetical protein
MKRLKWAILRATALGIGLAIGRLIIEYFLEPHPSNQVLINIILAFAIGFLLGLPLWYARFTGNKKET